MTMIYHDFAQGSPEWHQHRATHFNASDAPAMMGCSPYMTRTELLTRMKTGITAEVDAATQGRFDAGHRFEALARPLAEKIIGDDLYPVTGSRDELSASFDGLTLDGMTAFEHKTLNLSMAGLVWVSESAADFLPLHYLVQMEQQMLVSGAERVLFMASIWNGGMLVEERHCWYTGDKELRAKIIAGWQQFAKDLVEFKPTAAEVKPTGKAPEALPALRIEVTGAVTASNLSEFKAQALAVFQGINRDLKTDDDFANAEATVKWAKGIEDRLASAKESALAQTESIDALFRTIDDISAEARRVRLELEKLVKARKDALKADIVATGVSALAKHIRELNAAMPADYMPTVPADFGGAIKGLRTIDSITNAVDTELARAKIAASEVANRIHVNLAYAAGNIAKELMPDLAATVLKAPDDFAALVAQRKAAEQARQDAERERIRAEEAARLEREAAAKAAAEKAEADRGISEQGADAFAFTAQEAGFLKPQEHQPIGPIIGLDFASKPDIGTPDDNGARLTLGQINERLAPVSISVAGLSSLGFDPAEQVKASRLYRECDLPAICKAISAHVLAAAQTQTEAA